MKAEKCISFKKPHRFDLAESIRNTRRLAIVTTDECQARCAHCLMESGPSEKARLSLAQMTSALDFFIECGNLQQVTFTGGESTLLGSDLLEAIAYCADRGISTRLVTNVHWAKTRHEARNMLEDLREAGLDELNYSMDEFHAVWIPLENLKNAWYAAKKLGFSLVLIATCEGPRTRLTARSIGDYLGEDIPVIEGLDEDPRGLPSPLEDGTRYVISRSRISRLGRGRGLRTDYLYGEIDYGDYSRKIYGGCPGLFDPPSLNPDGTIGACCGVRSQKNQVLSLGADEIYNSEGNSESTSMKCRVLEALQILGPTILLRIASGRASIVEQNRIENPCEACEILTRTPAYLNALRDRLDTIERLLEAGYLTDYR